MGNKVFANGREVSCKADSGKSICAFPDVCMTPPQTPATPPGVPIPYPNTGMSSDTDGGSKKVKVSGKEVMLKDKSSFKKSTGDEAGSAPKKGLITGTNKGKVFFTSWSMDVKFEGENVVRHLDMTTHNHASSPGDTPPWPFTNSATSGQESKCEGEKAKEKEACKDYAPPDGKKDVCKEAGLDEGVIQYNSDAQAEGFEKAAAWADDTAKKANANECVKARRCQLVPYDGEKNGIDGCCKSQTPDHLIPQSSFFKVSVKHGELLDPWKGKYDPEKAPCMCAEGGNNTAGSHGLRHAHHKSKNIKAGTPRSFEDEKKDCAEGAAEVFKASGCSQACIEEQLENGHKGGGANKPPVKHSPSGRKLSPEDLKARREELAPGTVME